MTSRHPILRDTLLGGIIVRLSEQGFLAADVLMRPSQIRWLEQELLLRRIPGWHLHQLDHGRSNLFVCHEGREGILRTCLLDWDSVSNYTRRRLMRLPSQPVLRSSGSAGKSDMRTDTELTVFGR
jgi:hypothetical protein